MESKVCSECKLLKPQNQFYKCKKFKDGYAYVCKKCSEILEKEWRGKNPEKDKNAKREWAKKNKQKKREINKKYYHTKVKLNPLQRLNNSISSNIYYSLKGNKKGLHWEDLVGYKLEDLKKHLEKQFSDGMGWDNYGKWHLDHIIPLSVFNYEKPNHIDFERCWKLKNLRPLWAKENLIKQGYMDGSFQPSLAMG